jgi:flagellar hook assembly protein FlgD
MRTGLLFTLAVAWPLPGATCIPLVQIPQDQPTPPTGFGVTVLSPPIDGTVPQGAVLDIRWTALNNTGLSATAKVVVESRKDLSQTVLAESVTVSGSLTTTTQWNTSAFADGTYVAYVYLSTSEQTSSAASPGKITVDVPPTFKFTEPTENASLAQDQTLTIGWNGSDPEANGKVTIGLDLDADHTSGNELFLHEATLGKDASDDSFDWDGKDLTGNTVDPGTYNLFALVSDDVNPERGVDAGIQITVEAPSNENQALTLGITAPKTDTTFLTTDAPLTIEYGVNEFSDVYIDLRIDTDDNHTNGNEATVVSQRLVPGGTQTDTVDWDGTLVDGSPVADGIYRLFIVMNAGTDSPTTAEGTGLVFRRSAPNQPLIGLLEPAQVQTVQAGAYVTIRWRDDDPAGAATIRLTIDDDPNPAENEPGVTDDIAAPLLATPVRRTAICGRFRERFHRGGTTSLRTSRFSRMTRRGHPNSSRSRRLRWLSRTRRRHRGRNAAPDPTFTLLGLTGSFGFVPIRLYDSSIIRLLVPNNELTAIGEIEMSLAQAPLKQPVRITAIHPGGLSCARRCARPHGRTRVGRCLRCRLPSRLWFSSPCAPNAPARWS